MKMRAWLASACLAAAMFGCGGPEPTVDGGRSDADVDEDGGRNPCDGLTACTTLGTSCDGDDLVTCAVNADGCMAESEVRCTTDDQVCDDSSGTAACVDPCSLIPAAERCDAAARACTDGDTLEVCAANADGCYVRTVTECADMPGGICDDSTMPMCTTPADPCAGTPDACTTAGTSCDGESLVTCAPNAFGCLVETTADCTSRAGGLCDEAATVPACVFTGDPCTGITECTAPAEPSCLGGPELVTCAADAFGCMVETRVDCTAAPFGFCDETATGPDSCGTAATDPCLGMTECGTAASLTCSSDGAALVDCAPNAFGCFVETRTLCDGTCSAAGGTAECVDPTPTCPEAGTRVINCDSGTVAGDTSMGTMANTGDYGSCADSTNYAGSEQYWRFEHTGTGPVEVTIATSSPSSTSDFDLFVLDGAATSCTAADPVCLDGSRDGGGVESVSFQADPSDVAWVAYDSWGAATAVTTYNLTVTCTPIVCGDGTVSAGEQCDDGGTSDGNGCSATCTIEPGYICTGTTSSVCTLACGNGTLNTSAGETCDDGATVAGDGCSAMCAIEPGFGCGGSPSVCVPTPANATCAGALAITTTTALTNQASFAGGPPPTGTGCGPGPGTSTLYYAVTVPAMQTVDVTTAGSLDRVLFVQDSCGAATCTVGTDSAPERATLTNTTTADVTRIVGVRPYGSGTARFDISFIYAVCGDGYLSAGETCDDGGSSSGNGCSSTCQIEPGFLCSGAPSTCVAAPPSAFCATATAVTTTATFTGVDFAVGGPRPTTGCSTGFGTRAHNYAVTVPPGTSVAVSTTSSSDVVLVFRDACDTACTYSADDGFGTENGTLTNSGTAPVTRIVSVYPYSSSTTSGTFGITFQFPLCGDGILAATGETCDDGNGNPGDGCSATCAIEAGYNCVGAPSVCRIPAANSTCAGARIITDTAAFPGEDLAAGASSGVTCGGGSGGSTALFYTVTIPPATTATISVTPTGTPAWDPVLAEIATCGATTCVTGGTTDDGAAGDPESRRLVNAGTTAVTRTFLVRSWSAAFSTFDIAFSYVPLGCGDGFVDAPETCDDGGTSDGNGCSSTCTIEAGYRCAGVPSACVTVAGNATCAGATPITANTSLVGLFTLSGGPEPTGTGCGSSSGVDSLYYAVTIPPRTTVEARTTPAAGSDIVLNTQTACGPDCASTTNSAPEQVSLANTGTTDITRIVSVRNASSAAQATFDLAFTYHLCGDGAVSGPESCDDGNPTAGDGCSATCTVETGYTCGGSPSTCSMAGYSRAPIAAMCADTSAATPLTLGSGGAAADDKASAITALPFPLTYFGQPITHFSASMNGFVQLYGSSTGTIVGFVSNVTMPNASAPNGTLAAFWDDLYPTTGGGEIRTTTTGAVGSRVFTIAWIGFSAGSGNPTMTFQAQLYEATSAIEVHYCSVTGTTGRATGNDATIGLENQSGTAAALQSYNTASAVMTGSGFRFTPN